MNFLQKKEQYIQGLLDTNAFIVKSINEEPFTLRSGEKSYMFLDHSKLATSPKAYRAFIDIMGDLLYEVYNDNPFVLCNVDSKISAQMVGSLAYLQNKPQIIFKSKALTEMEKGTATQMTGNYEWDLPVAIMDDVMTGGDGTAKNVGDLVKETFPKIKDIRIFVGFIRTPTKSTYPTHHILTRNELLGIVSGKLSPDQQKAVEKELDLKYDN
jgi:orotate phosphoribosyltransferase